MDLHSVSSLNQQSVVRHTTPLGTYYPDSKLNSSLLLLNTACLTEKQQKNIFVPEM